MLSKLGKKKIAVLILAGSMVITGAGSAYAVDLGGGQSTGKALANRTGFAKMSAANQFNQGKPGAMTEGMRAPDGQGGPAGERKNPFSELVTAGTITQAQLDAIQEAMKSARESKKPMSDVLTELVSAGTLTQEQADAITSSMPAKEGKGGFTREHKNPLSELVTAGTITQEQLDAIQEAMKSTRESKQSMTDALAELVSAGTLTQNQADAVSTAVKPPQKTPKESEE